MTAEPLSRVLDRLEHVTRCGDGFTARCPNHDDRRNSLTISRGDDGRVLLSCKAGCDTADVLRRLDLSYPDLFPRSASNGHEATRRIVATYDYRDEAGKLLYQAVRFEPKGFSQRQPDGADGWIWNLHGVRRVPYRLRELRAADSAEPVFLVEGEKDADRLAALGLVATTCAMGAGKWRDEYNTALRDRHVVLLPDNDDPGRGHAADVARRLRGTARSVTVLPLPNLPTKGDMSDWLDAGGTVDKLRQLAAATEDSPSFSDIPQGASAASLPAVPVFPLDVLPPFIRQFVQEGAATLQVPPEFIAVPFLALAAGTIGHSRRLRIKRGFEVWPRLWLYVVGKPGSGKSPALNYARQPFDLAQQAAWETYQDALDAYEATPPKERTGKPPRPEHYFSTDPTIEALAPMLLTSAGVTLVRDELVGWVNSFDAYRKAGDRQAWLSLWSGHPLKPDRKTAQPIYVPTPAVSVVGGVQPAVLPDLAGEARRDDGFLDRFLPSWPDAGCPRWTDTEVNPASIAAVAPIVEKLRWPLRDGESVPVASLDTAARTLWREWYDENSAMTETTTGLAAGCAAKYPGQLASLALVLHALNITNSPVQPLSAHTLADAITLLEYFRGHLARVVPVLGAAAPVKTAGLIARIRRILHRVAPDWIDRTTISQKLGGRESSAAISAALQTLQERGEAITRPVATGGRAREEWQFHMHTPAEYEERWNKPTDEPLSPSFSIFRRGVDAHDDYEEGVV